MTRNARAILAAVSALLPAVLLAGCASTGSVVARAGATQPAAPTVAYVQPHCSFSGRNGLLPADPGRPGPRHGGDIPPGFAPVRVIGCGMDGAGVPIQTEAVGDLDDLIAAYRMPAPPFPPSTVCQLEFDHDPVIAFVDARGVAVWPAPPRDGRCGHVSTRVNRAVAALSWRVTQDGT